MIHTSWKSANYLHKDLKNRIEEREANLFLEVLMKLQSFSIQKQIYFLVVPLFLLVSGLGVYINFGIYSEWKQATSLEKKANEEKAISGFIHELQKERAKTVLFLNKSIEKSELDAQREIANAAHQKMDAGRNAKLESIRKSVEEGVSPGAAAAGYVELIAGLIQSQVDLFNGIHFRGEENKFSSLAIFEKAKENMGQLRAKLNQIFGSNQPLPAKELEVISSLKTNILANLQSPGLKLTPEGDERITHILNSQEWAGVLKKFDIVVEKYATGNYGVSPKEYSAEITSQIDRVYEVINSEHSTALKHLQEFVEGVKKKLLFFISAFVVVLIFTVFFSWNMIKSMTTSLKNVIENLNETTPKLTQSAEYLNDLSSSLSSCSTEQAAAVQETASSLEEVFGMVNRNAENAGRARDNSLQSLEQVKQGQESVEKMISSLKDISSNNEVLNEFISKNNKELEEIVSVITDIANKTKVINDIVFQTKLLSFNASVEAARAGEHGKGFAVVAEEIGNLAVMSGTSADEIKRLLDESNHKVRNIIAHTKENVEAISIEGSQKVKNGVVRAEECHQILNTIATAVEDLELIIQEVAVASTEQSKGISEVNKAMSQIDQVTHQNSQSSQDVSTRSGEVLTLSGSIKSSSDQLYDILNGKAA